MMNLNNLKNFIISSRKYRLAIVEGLLFMAVLGAQPVEIKGKLSLAYHQVDFGPSMDSGYLMDGDLDFKTALNKNVFARLDLEFDNMVSGSSAAGSSQRFDIGVDQAFFKIKDFVVTGLSLSVGKQNFNVSVRNNHSFTWAYGDPVSMIAKFSKSDWDASLYFLKLNEHPLGSVVSNIPKVYESDDVDSNVVGIMLEYEIAKKNIARLYLNHKSDRAPTAKFDRMFHYGLSVNTKFKEFFDFYAELACQNISDQRGINDGQAQQITLGLEKTWKAISSHPCLALEYYSQSGREGGHPAWQTVVGGMASANEESLFTEKNGSGARDINPGVGFVSKGTYSTGYRVVRVNASIKPNKDTTFGFSSHWFWIEDSLDKSGIPFEQSKLDCEYDLYTSWQYSPDVSFMSGVYWVTDINRQISGTGFTEDMFGVSLASALIF